MRRWTILRWISGAVAMGIGAGCQLILGLSGQDVALPDDGASCSNGVKDTSETDVDCGGEKCAPCPDGKRCMVGADCKDKVCEGGACAAPTCDDKAKNGEETDVDCGGMNCPKCSAGQGCAAGSDCISGTCTTMMTCAASCTDGVKDGSESDIDCGGTCQGCAIGLGCGVGADCEGGVCEAGQCVEFVAWTVRMGGMSGTDAARLVGLGIDGTGNAVLAANFTGKANFGGKSIYDTGSMSTQGFAFGRYDPTGNHIRDAGYVSGVQSQSQTAALLAVSPSGRFAAVGDYTSQGLDFGNAVTLPGVSPASIDAFVVHYDASDAALSAQKYGSQTGLNAHAFGAIATDSFGTAFVAAGSGTFGAYNLSTANMTNIAVQNGDLFIVDVGANWGLTFNDGGGSSDAFAGVTRDAAGNVVAAGHRNGILDFGGGKKDTATVGEGFVVKFGALGVYGWEKDFTASPDGLAVGADGTVVLCGVFTGSVDFGKGMLTSTGPSIFVAKLDPTGTPVWSQAFAISGATSAVNTLVATDVKGNILLATNMPTGMVDFGGGALGASFLVAKLDPSGSHLWSKGFGVGKLDRAVGIAAYDDTQVLIGGTFAGSLQIGSKSVSSLGVTDVFLAKLQLP
jgi:hypothetical protein